MTTDPMIAVTEVDPTGYVYEHRRIGDRHTLIFPAGATKDAMAQAKTRLQTALIRHHLRPADFKGVRGLGLGPDMNRYWGVRYDAQGFRELLGLARAREASRASNS